MKENESGEIVLTTDIVAMISPEGEKVSLGKGLRARGNVEDWLGRVEEAMFSILRRRMKEGIKDLAEKGREQFLYMHPSQVTCFISTVIYNKSCFEIFFTTQTSY